MSAPMPCPIESWRPLRFGEAVARPIPASHGEWLRMRDEGIGGSEVAAIVGENPWQDRYSLAVRKLYPHLLKPADSLAMRRGHHMESFIADEYSRRYGADVVTNLPPMRNVARAWHLLNLDALELAPCGRRIAALLDWKSSEHHWTEPPKPYRLQVLWYMLGTGITKARLVQLHGSRLRRFTLCFDADAAEKLLAAVKAYWEAFIVPRRLPPPSRHRASRETLAQIFTATPHTDRRGRQRPVFGSADEETVALAARLDDLRASRRELKVEIEELENLLQERLGTREAVRGGGFKVLRQKRQGRIDFSRLMEDLEIPVSVQEEYRGDDSFWVSVKKDRKNR